MKLYDFLTLSDAMQYQAVWDLGVFIDTIVYERINYQLYAIGDFYVEVLYCVSDNKITGKLAFKGGKPLEKYLLPLDIQ